MAKTFLNTADQVKPFYREQDGDPQAVSVEDFLGKIARFPKKMQHTITLKVTGLAELTAHVGKGQRVFVPPDHNISHLIVFRSQAQA
ncbi:MAG: hypothetical protein RIT04_599 [Candidatus Parcubacteria bacterium]|jgi:hypothetical protein